MPVSGGMWYNVRMRRKISVVLISAFLGIALLGCASGRWTEDGREAENVALFAMSISKNAPTEGSVYIHRGGGCLKVLEIREGGVIAQSMIRRRWQMEVFVETGDVYAEKEYLKPDLYEYIGVRDYVTQAGERHALRTFKKVPESKSGI